MSEHRSISDGKAGVDKTEAGPLMETWDQRISAFISGLKTGPLMDADGNADGKPDGIGTADGDLGSADISVYQRSKNLDR